MLQHEMEEEAVTQGVREDAWPQALQAGTFCTRSLQGENTEESTLTAAVQQELQRDEVEELVAELRKEGHHRARRRNWILGGVFAYIGTMIILAIFTHNKHLFSNIGSITTIMIAAAAVTKKQKQLTQALAKYKDDVRVAGPLAEALEYKDRKLIPIVSDVLIQLLPQLKASDRDRLNAEQRACLYRALRGRDWQLTLAILKSLQQIGDSKALPYVQKLAEDQRALSRAPQLREEIEICLPFLTDLAEREKNSQTLLRAADGNLTSSDVLLRPAGGAPITEPEQLLRPTVMPND